MSASEHVSPGPPSTALVPAGRLGARSGPGGMHSLGYLERRETLRAHFEDGAERWADLTGDDPVGGIRATVRAGRARMATSLLGWLPSSLHGMEVLDAGCGPGSLSVVLAARGARVTGVDISGALLEVAARRVRKAGVEERVTLVEGDMLEAARSGRFDAVVAMDSLIHYPRAEALGAVETLAAAARRRLLFTVAPWTPMLALMHLMGRAFPRSNRAPAIEPLRRRVLRRRVRERLGPAGWSLEDESEVHRGFYISHGVRLDRRAEAA